MTETFRHSFLINQNCDQTMEMQNENKCVQCDITFKSVQMYLNVLKTCSNVLVMAVTSGYGWVLGGNGLFLVVTIVFRL